MSSAENELTGEELEETGVEDTVDEELEPSETGSETGLDALVYISDSEDLDLSGFTVSADQVPDALRSEAGNHDTLHIYSPDVSIAKYIRKGEGSGDIIGRVIPAKNPDDLDVDSLPRYREVRVLRDIPVTNGSGYEGEEGREYFPPNDYKDEDFVPPSGLNAGSL